MDTVPFVGRCPDYEIIEGNMHISMGSWGVCMPLRVFKQGMARAQRVIAEYEAKRAEVVPMPKGSRRKHG